MPTAYTAFIEDGDITTAKDFILLCTRHFGIAMDIRDEPLTVSTPINFEPDSYYIERYNKAVVAEKLNRNIDFDKAKKQIQINYRTKIEDAKDRIIHMIRINDRYNKIKEEILKWNPPSTEYENIKEFALKQIEISMHSQKEFEYCYKVIDEPFDDSDEAVENYIKERNEKLENDVKTAKEKYDRAVEIAKEKTQFMIDLVNSLDNLSEEN